MCMSLLKQPVPFLCGHLLVHFAPSYRSTPTLAPKQLLGRSNRLPRLGSDFHICRCIFFLPIQLESLLCGHLLVHFVFSYRTMPKSAPVQILGRYSRLPRRGSVFHICRCMSLPMQLESLLRGHLLVHFVLSHRPIHKRDPKQCLGTSSR